MLLSFMSICINIYKKLGIDSHLAATVILYLADIIFDHCCIHYCISLSIHCGL